MDTGGLGVPGLLVLIVLGLALLVFALIGVLSTFRTTSIRRIRGRGEPGSPPAVSDPRFRELVQAFTLTPLREGHRIEILANGDETYPRLWRDLEAARHSITFQVYYAKPGRMADTLLRILAERARAGVRVLLLHDAFGAKDLSGEYIDALRAAGVEVEALRPIRWYSLHKAHHRSHTRAVVIDGRVGYTGGFGIDDKWYGDGKHPGQWRETNVRFTGPAVLQLQAAFAAAWMEATGSLLTDPALFPPAGAEPAGHQIAGLLFTTPTIASTAAERFFALSIAAARRTLYVSNSYFVPNHVFRNLLKQAVRRGVDVRILTASSNTDVKLTRWAARAHYEELLAAGVRIYEYRPSMMHAKTFVIDGLWSSIGAMNLDNRAMTLNDESSLLALEREVGAELSALFLRDLDHADEIRLNTFLQRPWRERWLERGATVLARLL